LNEGSGGRPAGRNLPDHRARPDAATSSPGRGHARRYGQVTGSRVYG